LIPIKNGRQMEIPLINLKEQFKGVKREVLKGITDILSEQRLVL
jgi:hypothetical protein